MTRLIRAELLKLGKRRMTMVLGLVMLSILVLLYFVLLAIAKANLPMGNGQSHENLLGLPVGIPFSLFILRFFGTIFAVILVSSSLGSEYSWRTIRTMLIRSESRSKMLGAKLIAALIFILLGILAGVVAAFILSVITTAIGGYAFSFSFLTGSYLWEQLVNFARTYYLMLPYVFLGYLMAVVGRSAMPGIAVGIGLFILEGLVDGLLGLAGGWIAKVPHYMPAENVQAIAALVKLPGRLGGMGGGGGATSTIGPWQATAVLAAYMAVFAFLAFYIFRKRDVTG